MFIRCTPTRNRHSGQPYLAYRLVHSARVGSSVKQSTRLNLGSHFDLPSTRARRAGPSAAELPLPGARAKRPRWTASTRKSGRNRYSVPCELHGQVVSTRL